MFDRLSDEASAPNFYSELEQDVATECSKLATAGAVLHCAADRWSNGFVYVRFEAVRDCVAEVSRMDGRFFAKQRILAQHLPEAEYERKWPPAKQKPPVLRPAAPLGSAPPVPAAAGAPPNPPAPAPGPSGQQLPGGAL